MRVQGVLPLPGSDRRGLDCVPVPVRERLGGSAVSAGLRSLRHGALVSVGTRVSPNPPSRRRPSGGAAAAGTRFARTGQTWPAGGYAGHAQHAAGALVLVAGRIAARQPRRDCQLQRWAAGYREHRGWASQGTSHARGNGRPPGRLARGCLVGCPACSRAAQRRRSELQTTFPVARPRRQPGRWMLQDCPRPPGCSCRPVTSTPRPARGNRQ